MHNYNIDIILSNFPKTVKIKHEALSTILPVAFIFAQISELLQVGVYDLASAMETPTCHIVWSCLNHVHLKSQKTRWTPIKSVVNNKY